MERKLVRWHLPGGVVALLEAEFQPPKLSLRAASRWALPQIFSLLIDTPHT